MSYLSECRIAQVAHQKLERFAQVAHQKWASMSESLRSLTKNERMSELLIFWAHSLIFFTKTSDSLRIPSPDCGRQCHSRAHCCWRQCHSRAHCCWRQCHSRAHCGRQCHSRAHCCWRQYHSRAHCGRQCHSRAHCCGLRCHSALSLDYKNLISCVKF